MMNKLYGFVSVGLIAGAFVACGAQNDPTGAGKSPVGGASSTQTSSSDTPTVGSFCAEPSASVCSDAQVLAISITSDAGEVMLAKSVRDRMTTADAKAFADKMIADHTQMMKDAQDLAAKLGITPQENGITKELQDSTKMEMEHLSTLSGLELDKSYIDHEVVDHLMDLGMTDHLLHPSAKAPELKSSLLDDRAKIATHETLALSVQATIEGSCGGSTGNTTDDNTGE